MVHEEYEDLFRTMQAGADGLPVPGQTARAWGARPGIDIPVDATGMVHPGTGGVSVSPNSSMHLPRHRRPPDLGGTGKDPVWRMSSRNLAPNLSYRSDPNNPSGHGFIEPAHPMTFDQDQQALAAIRQAWQPVAP